MQTQDDSQRRSELRIAFLKHLPQRVDHLVARARAFCDSGWDINGQALLTEDLKRLAGAAGTHGAIESSQLMLSVDAILADCLQRESVPDDSETAQLISLLDELSPKGREVPQATRPAAPANAHDAFDSTRIEVPPANYWRRWASDAPEPVAQQAATTASVSSAPEPPPEFSAAELAHALSEDSATSADVVNVTTRAAEPLARGPSDAPVLSPRQATRSPAPSKPVNAPKAAAKPKPAPPSPKKTNNSALVVGGRIYHLSDASELSVELDQQLETMGYELELLDTADELKEVLAALPPDLVIVDSGFVADIESIGTVLRSTRERTTSALPLILISDDDSVPVKLAARRGGADSLMIRPRGADEVIAKLQSLLQGEVEDVFKVMIVEDDRSQALFAESILRNAGMETRVVLEAFDVLTAMEEFRPDMVLMDFYMPECDGTELTALIREREEFLQTPIVFLSGESDVDKQYDALEAGGDDFLSKPIRPKHLIAAVSNRVKRARARLKKAAERDPRDPASGLYFRSHVLESLAGMVALPDIRDQAGGVLFIDLDGLSQLRERIGLTGVERLLTQTGRLLVDHVAADEQVTRFSDGCFIVLCPRHTDAALESHAISLRATLASHAFEVDGRPVRLRPSIGICAIRHDFVDAGRLLNTSERLAKDARSTERSVLAYEPPKSEEQAREDSLVQTIRDAIQNDSFELLYQPIVAVQGGEDPQYQTLVRLRETSGQLLAAGQVLPVAEAHGLMADIDRWVMAHALRVIEARRGEGQSLRLFVNQSASTMVAADQIEWVTNQLKMRGVPGDSLVVELTLADVETRLEAVNQFCRGLLPLGVGFCLSQTDASDITALVLEKLPVAYIKLANKYVTNNQSAESKKELSQLVNRAQSRDLKVIAQRVEDAQAAATLWMSGIDFVQGNLVQPAGRELKFDFQSAVL